jgi:hypothetical protein
MIYRAFAIAAAASALLCIVIAAVWFRSFSAVQQVVAYHEHRYSLVVARGRFQLERCTCLETFTGEDGPVLEPTPYSERWTFRFGARAPDPNGECDRPNDEPSDAPSRPDQEDRHEIAAGPIWPATALTAAAPLLLVARRLSRSRSRPGCCRQCGYDLRGSTNRCPECGRQIGTAKVKDDVESNWRCDD